MRLTQAFGPFSKVENHMTVMFTIELHQVRLVESQYNVFVLVLTLHSEIPLHEDVKNISLGYLFSLLLA